MITKRTAAVQAALDIMAHTDNTPLDLYVPAKMSPSQFRDAIKKELAKRKVSGVWLATSTIGDDYVLVAKKNYRPLFGKCQRMERYRFEHRNEGLT